MNETKQILLCKMQSRHVMWDIIITVKYFFHERIIRIVFDLKYDKFLFWENAAVAIAVVRFSAFFRCNIAVRVHYI